MLEGVSRGIKSFFLSPIYSIIRRVSPYAIRTAKNPSFIRKIAKLPRAFDAARLELDRARDSECRLRVFHTNRESRERLYVGVDARFRIFNG